MKEFPNESKNKWTRIFKKKWFFPALYIVLAVFLLSGVVWYQAAQSNLYEGLDDVKDSEHQKDDDFQSNRFEEEAKSVNKQQETIKMPVQEEAKAEIVTKFYDHNAEVEEQEKGLTFYNNRYYQSTGVDIAADDGKAFEVTASLSGTVEEVKQDPLHGNVIVLDHGDEISTYYASLQETKVKEGDKVKQGDLLGTAGKNLFSEESGTHVHFEISKEDTGLNPEDFFNHSLTALKETNVDSVSESEDTDEKTEEDTVNTDDEDVDDVEDESDENAEDEQNEEDTETSKDLSFSLPV